ncbi:hypothetical protein RB5093 [Rhodopirellula baltica SH 1]|uniref:Uncharacterized protein n=1 Tax=Rhodopirellula baltica (strain DSM 10527 / NCIMB 13988 / SH1) TaxID=243090 RepID=Q7UGP7_RHOBA|nr:hypothetical protein RB5093 [Rhodopirellula baltica SH 1]
MNWKAILPDPRFVWSSRHCTVTGFAKNLDASQPKHLNSAEASYGLASHVGQVLPGNQADSLEQSEAV